MKTGAIATVLFFLASGAQAQTHPFTYNGWAVGISFDSAQKLAYRDVHTGFSCTAFGEAQLTCNAINGVESGGMASVQLGKPPRKVISVGLLIPISSIASTGSIKRDFIKRWGAPKDLSRMARPIQGRSFKTQTIAIWMANGSIAAIADEHMLGNRKLSIQLSGDEAQRDMIEDALRKRGLSADSIKKLLDRIPKSH